jgi:peptidoglycan/LPS O-acetylase OafA/YrhL
VTWQRSARNLCEPPDPMSQSVCRDPEVPALTGLRGIAALSILAAHTAGPMLRFSPESPLRDSLRLLAFLGMTLFFVLSGFVIHYNYRHQILSEPAKGYLAFLWARFTRLYPLFLFMLVTSTIFDQNMFASAVASSYSVDSFSIVLPFYLTFSQSWSNTSIDNVKIITGLGVDASITWSISTEWFFYLLYPIFALLLTRLNRLQTIGFSLLTFAASWAILAYAIDVSCADPDYWRVARYGARNAPQDSSADFFSWLEYYSPFVRIGEFILGNLVAQFVVRLRDVPVSSKEARAGELFAAIALLTVPIFLYVSRYFSSEAGFIFHLRHNFLLAPSAAVLIFCASRYQTYLLSFLKSRPIIWIGEISYSIYLSHIFILHAISRAQGDQLQLTVTNLLFGGARYILACTFIVAASYGLYATVEVPSRRWLRRAGSPGHLSRRLAYLISAGAPIVALLWLGYATGGPFLRHLLPRERIEIIGATYGANCGAPLGNVTARLSAACEGRFSCDYAVDVAVLGDPANGCAKDFTAEYTCSTDGAHGRIALPGEAGFKSHAILSCPIPANVSEN